MSRSTWILAGFFVAGCLAVVGYSRITRVEPAATDAPRALVAASPSEAISAPSAQAPTGAPAEATNPASQDPALSSAEPAADPNSPEAIDKLAADAMGKDVDARAAAITALAEAPKDAAFPVLKRVLTGGDPHVDRPLALGSLRTLAIKQGDSDGRIRDLLRQTVSHADNEMLASGAQSVLDEVEQRY